MKGKQKLLVKKFNENIEKKGKVKKSLRKKEEKFPVGPAILAVLLFVVIGSVFVQILNYAQNSHVIR